MLNELEKVTLKHMLLKSGKEVADDKFEEIIDVSLSFQDNKKLIKNYLKGEGHVLDLKTELLSEKELANKKAQYNKSKAEEMESKQYTKAAATKDTITSEVVEKTPEIIKEIYDYNPYCENITYSTIFAAMNANIGKQKTNIINKGKQGVGKSRGSSELVKRLDIPGAKIITGWMTPKKLFETLREFRYGVVVLDESELIMSDPKAMFILRSALYGGIVSWQTSKGEEEDRFKFEGTIIANLNHFTVNQHQADPLFDRVLFNETDLNNKQIFEKMKSKDTYSMRDDLWELVQGRIALVRKEGITRLNEDESKKVLSYVESLVATSSVFNKTLSTRAIGRAKLVASCMKSLFTMMTDDIWNLTMRLIKPYVLVDTADDIAVSLLMQNSNLTRIELTELLADKKGISARQASRHIKASIERGALVSVNRYKVAVAGVGTNGGKEEDKHEKEGRDKGEQVCS